MLNKLLENRFCRLFMTIMLSASLYYFSTGIYDCWPLVWVAPLPVILYALRVSSRWAGFAGIITYFIGFSSGMLAYSKTLIPIGVLALGNIVNAVVFTGLLLLFRHIALKKQHWLWSLVIAGGWTGYEFIIAQYSPAGSFDSIAYTQVSNKLLIQIASITGIWGICFLVMFIPASMALGWYYRNNTKLMLTAVGIPISILTFILLFGFYRLSVPAQGPSVKVGMAAIGVNLAELRARGQAAVAERVMSSYLHSIESLSRSGAEVIVLPEKIIEINAKERAGMLQKLTAAAEKYQVTVITGMSSQADDNQWYNSAYWFSPQGENVLRYDKQHLLPFSENRYTAGQVYHRKDMEGKGIWGVAICKDMDFTEPSRGYSQQGINLLLVPALDFKTDAWLHARIAVMRGVEGNFAVARAAQWGLLSLSDNRGNLIDSVPSISETGEFLLLKEIRLDPGQSLYARWGDWFGYVSIGLFFVSVLFFLVMDWPKTDTPIVKSWKI